MSNLKVQVGQPVQYIGIDNYPLAAVVTKLNDNGTVNLRVFQDKEVEPSLAYDVLQYVNTFDERKIDQSHSFKVIRF